MAAPVLIAKAAAALLTSEKRRKAVVGVLIAALSPLILIIAVVCSTASGAAAHNNRVVEACFYGASFSEKVPHEFQQQIQRMRLAFAAIDAEVALVNSNTESGNGLDPIRVKAVYYVLCFDGGQPSRQEARDFVGCFYTVEERTREVETDAGTVEETYKVNVPLPLEMAYTKLSALLGKPVTSADKSNVNYIYNKVAGPAGGGSYNGGYQRGSGTAVDLDISTFKDPTNKNASDLVTYAIHAWESGWGYVWGTYGDVLTESMYAYKLGQYPDGVGRYADFIRANWLGGRTTDCVGLIKGYGWLDPDSLAICYGTNGMPDVSANQMYYSASVSGTIDTIPDIPGLAVWHDGHIGVYIGNGEVIEAMGTKYGVVKTQLDGRGWTHWLKVEYIDY